MLPTERGFAEMSRKTIFCIHGFSGSSADWERLPILSSIDKFNFVNAKVPGHLHYKSELSKSLDLALIDLMSQAESIKSDRFYVMGYSMGGRLALMLANSELASRIDGIILISSGLGGLSESEKLVRKERDSKHAESLLQDPERFWLEWYQQPIFNTIKGLSFDLLGQLIESKSLHDIQDLANVLREFSPAQHDNLLTDRLQRIPLLFLAGTNDIKYVSEGQKLVERHKLSSFVQVDDASHSLLWEQPVATSNAIGDWLQ